MRPAPRKQKFSDGFIKRLQPRPTRAYAVWDTRQPGLAVVVQPSGHRAFKFVYSFKSRPRWYHLGNAVIPVAAARKLAAGVMLKVIEGHDPAAEKKAERQGSTFAELAQAYVERHAKQKNKSWQQADKLVRKHLLPRWGKLSATAITRTDVKTMMSRIEAPSRRRTNEAIRIPKMYNRFFMKGYAANYNSKVARWTHSVGCQ
jgi:Arm DNA-binding domain